MEPWELMQKRARLETARLRRHQIIEAAVAVIAERGLQHCSLSEIEKRAGMCRGQLTYYFHTKEEILLAVFDHLLGLLHQQAKGECGAAREASRAPASGRLRSLLTHLLLEPPTALEFHSLHYTFLSQIGHRDDFRQRLADLYEEWRGGIAQILVADQPDGASARTVASMIQAILHGLAVQRRVDPESCDPEEMVELCVEVLSKYLRPRADERLSRRQTRKQVSTNGSSDRGAARRSTRSSRATHE
jgi:AcrR family transcriptional regulator